MYGRLPLFIVVIFGRMYSNPIKLVTFYTAPFKVLLSVLRPTRAWIKKWYMNIVAPNELYDMVMTFHFGPQTLRREG